MRLALPVLRQRRVFQVSGSKQGKLIPKQKLNLRLVGRVVLNDVVEATEEGLVEIFRMVCCRDEQAVRTMK